MNLASLKEGKKYVAVKGRISQVIIGMSLAREQIVLKR